MSLRYPGSQGERLSGAFIVGNLWQSPIYQCSTHPTDGLQL